MDPRKDVVRPDPTVESIQRDFCMDSRKDVIRAIDELVLLRYAQFIVWMTGRISLVADPTVESIQRDLRMDSRKDVIQAVDELVLLRYAQFIVRMTGRISLVADPTVESIHRDLRMDSRKDEYAGPILLPNQSSGMFFWVPGRVLNVRIRNS